MGRRREKVYRAQTFKIEITVADRLDAYSEKTGVSKTFVVEKAVREYLDRVDTDDQK